MASIPPQNWICCDTVSKAPKFFPRGEVRLKGLRKKPEQQIPRRLKSPRDDKNKGRNDAPEGAPLQKQSAHTVFAQAVKSYPNTKPSQNEIFGPQGWVKQCHFKAALPIDDTAVAP
jgi:hypothetical protein